MSIQLQGSSGNVMEVEANSLAVRTVQRPRDVASLGAYEIAYQSGTMAAGLAGAAPVFSLRWGDSSRLALISRFDLMMKSLGTGFTAGAMLFTLWFARGFSVADTGGSSILPTGNSQKKRTSPFGTTLISDLRASATATLTAGTRTLDGNPLSSLASVATTAVHTQFVGAGGSLIPLLYPEGGSQWPIVLSQNEGIVLQATVPATGTWDFIVHLVWEEVSAF